MMSEPDAGAVDAGAPEEDAGVDAGTPGEELDAGEMMSGAGGGGGIGKDDTRVDTGKLRPGCGCNADPGALFMLGAIALLLTRRRA
jgi:MYXO-CTERM domain-containing protein